MKRLGSEWVNACLRRSARRLRRGEPGARGAGRSLIVWKSGCAGAASSGSLGVQEPHRLEVWVRRSLIVWKSGCAGASSSGSLGVQEPHRLEVWVRRSLIVSTSESLEVSG
eukprot:gene5262-biopygen4181